MPDQLTGKIKSRSDHGAGGASQGKALQAALASRHADTLDGRFRELDTVEAPHVTIGISEASAETLAGQHLAVHLGNLIGRLEGVVSSISVAGGIDVRLLPHVDPRAPAGGETLAAAVRRAAALAAEHRIDAPTAKACPTITIQVGSGEPHEADVFVAAGAWTGSVGRRPGPECGGGHVPAVGAHLAAALGAGEVFRMIRGKGARTAGTGSLMFSAWSWRRVVSLAAGDAEAALEGARWDGLAIPAFTLVGVGAVGTAMLLTLWSSGVVVPRAEVVDGDPVSTTNLNRYVLFSIADRGLLKVERAAELLARVGDRPFHIVQWPVWWSDHQRALPETPIPLLVSAVDTNVIRHQLQDTLPDVLLGGSTHGLRAEVNRYDLSDDGSRCLKCFNPREMKEEDALLQRRLLGLNGEALLREAEDRGIELDRLQAYIEDLRRGGTGCAYLAGPELDKLRREDGEGGFAVSFVSGLAGTLLAAQLIREALGVPLLRPPATRAILQLWNPAAESNGVYPAPREAECWCARGDVRAAHRARWKR
jgi:hypothetical protein